MTSAPLQQVCIRILLLVLVPQTKLPGEESKGTPEKVSQWRESVGERPEASILVLVGWLKTGPLCSDDVADAIAADFIG
jgi:hypothetical protein